MTIKSALDNIKVFYFNNKNTIQFLLLIILVTVVIISVRSCSQNQISTNRIKVANDSLNMKIKEYIDNQQKTHAQIQQLELSNKELKSLNSNLESHYNNKIDSLSKILKVKSNQIVEYISIISSAKGSGIVPILPFFEQKKNILKLPSINLNTDPPYKFIVNDGYLLFDGEIPESLDSLKYAYVYTDSAMLTNFYHRKGLFGWRKEYTWDIVLSNPQAKIKGLEQFKKVQSSYKRFAVTLGTSYGADSKFNLIWTPITITVGYKLFEF